MQGCRFVLHVASPFVIAEPRNEDDLIAPAVEGTKRVISAARRAGEKRLVLTSSTVSISSGKDSGMYGPDAWSDTSARIGAYAKSKTLAERAAWAEAKGGDMELVVIAPGAVFGPSLGAQLEGQSVALMTAMIGGKMPMIPDMSMGMVDVRDIARLHVAALAAVDAAGKRFIASTAQPVEMATMARVLRQAGYAKVPSRRAPSILLRIMSLFDREVRGMLPYLGKSVSYDISATLKVLRWTPTPMETSFREMAAGISA
jgi:dihydroflavonol-4-reductase